MGKSTRECVVLSDTIETQLRSFGKLPKCVKVVVKEQFYRSTRTNNYAVVRVRVGDMSVIVPYETLRKLVQSLKGKQLEINISKKGLELGYSSGNVFLKHLGEWEDVVELKIAV